LLNKEYFQTENFKPAYLDLLNQQRNWLIEIDHASPEIDEELIREQLHLLDIEEERLKNS
jgi:CPA1 family monovalent cation:H+ antiporter